MKDYLMKNLIMAISIVVLSIVPVCWGEDVIDGDIVQLDVEDLGVPVRTMRRGDEFLVPKPELGWWLITSYNPVSRNSLPLQAYIIDLDSGEVEMTKREPSGALYRGLMGQDGMFYMGHYAKMGMWRFDPAEGSLEWIDFPDMQQRILPYRMQMASDGRIYMGTASAVAHVVEFDPATENFRDFGVQGHPHGSPRYIYSMAVGEDYVYSAAGKNPWYLVATHRETMEQKILMKGMEYLSVGGSGENCYATVTPVTENDEKPEREYYMLKDGEAIKNDGPPQRRPALAEPDRKPPELLMTRARPDSEGRAEVWWKPNGGEWQSVQLNNIQTTPWRFLALTELADGRILGAPGAYEDFFLYDPETNEFEIVGKSPLSCSAMERIGETVYLMGYPGTYMVEYDPNRPWTYFTTTPEQDEPKLTDPESNPRECHRWSVGIMPTHHVRGSAVGADGFIYMGGHAERGAVGGGLGWWDPVNRKAEGIREPFELQDCDDICAARDGELIVYSSRPVADPGTQRPAPDTGKLFILDVAEKETVNEITPVPGARRCGPVAAIGDLVYGVAQQGDKYIFYVINIAEGKTIHSAEIASGASDLKIGPDGKIYAFIGDVLTRIDPNTFELIPLGSVENAGRMLFKGNDIYLTGLNLRRINNVPELKAIINAE